MWSRCFELPLEKKRNFDLEGEAKCKPVNGVDQAHDAATISSPPTEHSEDLPQLPEDPENEA